MANSCASVCPSEPLDAAITASAKIAGLIAAKICARSSGDRPDAPCAKCVLRIERCRTKQDEGRRRERRLSRSCSSSSSTRGISGAGNELCRSASHLKATPTRPHAAPPSLSASLYTRFSSEVVSGARMLRQNTISRDHNRQRVRKKATRPKSVLPALALAGERGRTKKREQKDMRHAVIHGGLRARLLRAGLLPACALEKRPSGYRHHAGQVRISRSHDPACKMQQGG
ncbi:hypothetical protein L1887_50606 [Cichorium endivia]|nr:hypothetical protein L1887_50606 [Cichorium endivia]